MTKKKMFERYNCELKNESACEEEVEQDGMDYEEVEGEEFGE